MQLRYEYDDGSTGTMLFAGDMAGWAARRVAPGADRVRVDEVQARKLTTGDVVLVDIDGQMRPAEVLDANRDGDLVELDLRYGDGAAETLGVDAAGTSRGSAVRISLRNWSRRRRRRSGPRPS